MNMKKHRKHRLLVLLAISICATVGNVFAEEWGALTNGVQISICLATNQPVTTNGPVVILFKIRNTLTNEMASFFSDGSPENSFRYKIIAPSGDAAPRNTDIIYGGSLGVYEIPPKATKEYPVNLSLLYRFNEVGTYKIVGRAEAESQASTLSHKAIMFDEDKSFVVISNPLEIKVVPGNK